MNNRFSPSPDPAPQPQQQPASNTPPFLQGENADLVPVLGRFALIALTVTLVFVLAFRLIGFNRVGSKPAADRAESSGPPPLVPSPMPYTPSAASAANNSGPTSAGYTGQPSQPWSSSTIASNGYGTGSKLLRLEDGKFNEAVRQWVGGEPPRASLNVPVDAGITPAPVPRFLPTPSVAP